MDGAEFLTPGSGPVQVLQQDPGACLLSDPSRRVWLPWGRRSDDAGDWPAGGMAPWSSIYRANWQCWAPERVLLRPLRWRASSGRWVDLRPGFAILALQLHKAPGTPLYIVTLDGGAPKLMPRVADWEEDQTARWREAEARQNALDEVAEHKARLANEIFLMEIEGAFGSGQDLNRPDDFYLRMVANLAHDGKESVPDASDKEVDIFLKGRKHLPKSVFDADRWQAISGASWKKVVYVLNRGGRFDTQEASFKGDMVANKWGKQVNLYQEKTWKAKDAFTGKHYFGMARFVPIVNVMDEPPTAFIKGHDLHLVTQRDVRMTKSRTIANSYLTSHMPENAIIVHTSDAKRLGLRNGQKVKVVSATNPKGEYDLKNGKAKAMVGKVWPTETIRPGIVTFTLGHGHWATGAADMTVDGTVIKADPKRGGGIHANAAMWVDPYLKNTCMIDKVGGSVSFYDTRVKLVKVKA